MKELADKYPTIHPAYITVRNDDIVHLRAGPWSGSTFTVRDEPSGADAKLFDLLDGKHPYSAILDRVGPRDSVEEILSKLSRENILYFLDEQTGYPSRRIPHQRTDVERLVPETGDIAYLLLTYGDIGGLVLDELRHVDGQFDHVSLTDSDEIETSDLSEHDFGIVLTDRFKPTLVERFNSVALEADFPWIVGQVNGFDAVVGPTIVPGETACYRCYLDRVRSNIDDQLFELYYEGSKQVEPEPGFKSLCHMVESYVGVELAHVEQFGQGYTVERTVTVSGATMRTNINDVLKLPRCSACTQLRDRKRFVGYADFPGSTER